MGKLTEVIYWWASVLRFEAIEMWRCLPGPWWCKLAILVLVLAIPGQLDEIALLAILSALRGRRARKTAQAASAT